MMRSLFIITLLLVCAGFAHAQSIAQKADAAMRRVFGDKSELSKETVAIDQTIIDHVKARTGEDVRDKAIVHEARNGGKIVGYGIVDDVRGKAQPITYITLITPEGKISDIEVVVYREPYGGEIGYETFRKQFRGKQASSKLRVGEDIQNMAGATISSKAITRGAKKIVVLFDELKKGGKL
jgi:Na+-translocating ferredoxin:NAD+ oxidoreductase RnfG subunit